LNAFGCDEPLCFLQDKVLNFSIKSNSDLSANFKAGSELSALFIPVELQANCLGKLGNSSDCLADYSKFEGINSMEDAINQLMAINFYLGEKGRSNVVLLNLLSMKTVETIIENKHQIALKFDFESGNSVELKTAEIIIK